MTGQLPASGAAHLIVVRHGEPEAWALGRCCGHLDPGLSPTGLAQADVIADTLGIESISTVISSPSRRALETAAPTARRLGLSVVTMPALVEIDFGEMEGLTFDEAAARFPETCRIWVERPEDVRFPGGESFAVVDERVRAAARTILAEYAGTPVVFTHGGPIRVLHSLTAPMPASPWAHAVPWGHVLRFDVSRDVV